MSREQYTKRMADYIQTDCNFNPDYCDERRQNRLLEILPRCQRFLCDEAVNYVETLLTGEKHLDWAGDCPILFPPFSQCWFEWKRKDHMAGVLIDFTHTPGGVPRMRNQMWLYYRDVNIFVPTAEMDITLKDDGYFDTYSMVWRNHNDSLWNAAVHSLDPVAQEIHRSPYDVVVECVLTSMLPMFYVMSFLNCSNVTTRDIRCPLQLATKSGIKSLNYKVLNIDLFRKSADSHGGGMSGLRSAMSLHIVRRHIRVLRDERYSRDASGNPRAIVIEPHIRGSAENGITTKDYRVRV